MSESFQSVFYSFMPETPTADQRDLVERMERFLFQPIERAGFIIRGYAGTGKTTSIAALVKTLPAFRYKSVLLAPTGRAAKVMATFSNKKALTIHKKIYQVKRGGDGQMNFALAANIHSNTIFMVDEASMISDRGGIRQRSLLEDLITYVYSGKNCRLVFIGDVAQLPPVGSELSPALDPKYLKGNFFMNLKGVELKQVMRQADESGILFNASRLRNELLKEEPQIKFKLSDFDDIHRITGLELEDELNTAYAQFGESNVMMITRSNKRANEFNQQIRIRIKDQESSISSGDYLMVVKNNYFWLDDTSPAGFIANGDIAEVMRVGNHELLYEFAFVEVTLRLIDYPQMPTFDVKILVDTIYAEAPALSKAENRKLYENVMADYLDETSQRKRMELLKKNPYFNALQVKFANAVTCHKSQGGQWPAVFVDQGYLTEEMVDREYIRWLYTAVSRATQKLYLVNFHPRFFEEEESFD